MNCLWGDPTEAKELPMIEAAASAGCEYYVIDAGWYAELNEDWSQTTGAWSLLKRAGRMGSSMCSIKSGIPG
jgi:alpha-galactosidase